MYLSLVWQSFLDLPAIIVDIIGHKFSMAIIFILACVFLLPLAFHESAILTTVLLFGVRVCATGTITVASFYTPEIYPTSMRTTGKELWAQ
ncbi:hypothetical protein LWI29_013394 [Acer saccharum]|uniref:Major facilitator superfamily (MFS) profile domain-containing protein n=1 Tax=Acer saccharum TaxID=4024 RepID=A0AA39RD46_ACESA|nr:hypothetical protein LWI29_013394 [Acer saccharum]